LRLVGVCYAVASRGASWLGQVPTAIAVGVVRLRRLVAGCFEVVLVAAVQGWAWLVMASSGEVF
jgi:hypothetical protein